MSSSTCIMLCIEGVYVSRHSMEVDIKQSALSQHFSKKLYAYGDKDRDGKKVNRCLK